MFKTVYCNKMLLFRHFVIICILPIVLLANVEDELKALNTLESMESYCYEHINDSYRIGCFLRYTPVFFVEKQINQVPPWLRTAITNSLVSNNDDLVESAIIASERLNVDENNEQIKNICINSTSISLKRTAINALGNFQDNNTTLFLFEIFNSYTNFFDEDIDFENLLDILSYRDNLCDIIPDKTEGKKNAKEYKKKINSRISKLISKSMEQDEKRSELKRMMKNVQIILDKLECKEGGR